jgi:RimJ/RimL family protein N-acetyltransferase
VRPCAVRSPYAASVSDPLGQDFSRVRSPFEGAAIRLRAIEEDDLPWINGEFWNPAVTEHLLMVWPEPALGTMDWWEGTRRGSGIALLVETKDAERVGVCALEDVSGRSRTATLGIWLAEAWWGRGYGTDAVRKLCRFGFREMNLQRIQLSVFATNERARRAYLRAGFAEEGRLRRGHFVGGRHVDVTVMGLVAEEVGEP